MAPYVLPLLLCPTSGGEQTATHSVYVCILADVNSKELVRMLEADGWRLSRVRGSHHQYSHPSKPGTVTVPHPRKDLGKGIVAAILRQAGLK